MPLKPAPTSTLQDLSPARKTSNTATTPATRKSVYQSTNPTLLPPLLTTTRPNINAPTSAVLSLPLTIITSSRPTFPITPTSTYTTTVSSLPPTTATRSILAHSIPSPSDPSTPSHFTSAITTTVATTANINNNNNNTLQHLNNNSDDINTNTSNPPPTQPTHAREEELERIRTILTNPATLFDTPFAKHEQLIKRARHFFMRDECLWRWQAQGRHQLVLTPSQCGTTLHDTHDGLSHKGYYPTLCTILDRFWWPTLAHNVKQYIQTCHECQLRQTTKVHIPPTVATPAPLFRKAYIDTMFMPPTASFRYIVRACCSLNA
jgi:hypothetical protein